MENQTELKWYQKPKGVIILLIFFFPVGLYQMWKNELWTKKTRWIATGVVTVMFIANSGNNNSSVSNSSSNSSNSSSSSSKGLETSKKAYRQGYSDGQPCYGFQGAPCASAFEYYMAYGYNYSKADYNVYVMGYNDGRYGRTKQY